MEKLTIEKEFAQRLKQLIVEECGGRQSAFCALTGITPSFLSMVLSGKRGPSAKLVSGITVHFGEWAHWVLTGDESRADTVHDNSDDSGPRGFSANILTATVIAIEEALAQRKRMRKLSPEEKARLVVSLYEVAFSNGKPPSKTAIQAALRLLG